MISRKGIYATFISQFILSCVTLHGQGNSSTSNRKYVSIDGQISVYTSFYSSEGIDPRKKSFSWCITGNPVLHIWNVSIPLSFIVGEPERNFRQPFDQAGLTPEYKWMKGYIGYSNVTWSPFTWAGQTLFGIGIELTPAKFRFGFLYGRLNRPVPEDTLSVYSQTPAYRRVGFAAKIGYGTASNFVDVIFLKAKDDPGSVPYIPVKTEVMPAENAVAGITSRQRLGKFFNWNLDAAVSLYTRDLRSMPLSSDAGDIRTGFSWLLDVNTSTQYYYALQSDLGFHIKQFRIKLRYRRVDPDYKSMGAYYFQSDIENITLDASLAVMKNKLSFNASIGKQRDNLLNRKQFSSIRLIGSAGFTWNPVRQFGMNLLYSNYSADQVKGRITPSDSMKQTFVTQNLTICPRLSLISSTMVHLFLLTYNRQWFNDKNPVTASFTQYTSNNLNANYSLSLTKEAMTLNISYMMNVLKLDTNNIAFYGISVSGNKSFFNNSLQTVIRIYYSINKVNEIKTADIVNLTLGATCRITKHNAITINFHYLNNQGSSSRQRTFSEMTLDLGYTHTF